MHARDCEPDGFEWLIVDDDANSVFAWLRKAGDGQPPVVVVANFTPVPRDDYRLPLPKAGRWRERLNTDADDLWRQRARQSGRDRRARRAVPWPAGQRGDLAAADGDGDVRDIRKADRNTDGAA